MYKPEGFLPHEFVTKKVYDRFGIKSFMFIDSRLLRTMEMLKKRYGCTITINNYNYGGEREFSGLRQPGDQFYNPNSQHSLGNACDALFSGYSAEEIRKDILRYHNGIEAYAYITGIELGVTWNHIEIGNRPDQIYTFTQ